MTPVVTVGPAARNVAGYGSLDRLRQRARQLRRPPVPPRHLFGDYRDSYVIGCYAAAVRRQERRELAARLWMRWAAASWLRGRL